MERESFESAEIAAVMNELFVNIKVDREERPDLDDVYMAAVQMMTGQGGWPMSVFVEPGTLRPFWGGTYFPPRPAFGRPGFEEILRKVSKAYADSPGDVGKQGLAIAEAVEEHLSARGEPVMLDSDDVQRGCSTLLTIHDRVNGGFGSQPKFPQPVYLDLLLAARGRAGDDTTRDAVDQVLKVTLGKMAMGGVFDQVGGGFHRYSVDQTWTVPHFEKMLYDQAQLMSVYARAARVYEDGFYANIARRIGGYVLREMTHAAGGFFSAQDAEVDGREGLNYLWTPAELKAHLSAADAAFAGEVFGVNGGPNFQDPHHPKEPARSVLRLAERPTETAARLNMTEGEYLERLRRIQGEMLRVRGGRRQPRLDDKCITAWNGLMSGAMAEAGVLLGEELFVQAGERAMGFVLTKMVDAEGRLVRTWREGAVGGRAVLEDYAAVVHGLARLAGAAENVDTADAEFAAERGRSRATWIQHARSLLGHADSMFGDGGGGYFDTREGESDVFVRARSTYDGAMPSGSAVMLNALIDLHEITGEDEFAARARRLLATMSAAIKESPVSTALGTVGLLRLLTLDRESVRQSLAARGAKRGVGEEMKRQPVQVMASENAVRVSEDEPGTLRLKMTIDEGYHINAFDAGEASGGVVVPMRVDLVGATGLAAYADYPAGELVEGAEHRVISGEVEFDVAIEKTGPVSGLGRLMLSFQCCTREACLAPMMVELDVQIEVG